MEAGRMKVWKGMGWRQGERSEGKGNEIRRSRKGDREKGSKRRSDIDKEEEDNGREVYYMAWQRQGGKERRNRDRVEEEEEEERKEMLK
ncbi:hypothetical protein Pcinc_043527 [Petrolisthes cinctipes]|uniref:Uncharacterized protein n=1 Tax=Petrolisthes cinctipes TaxID=88211 RepID=A0AAE1EHT2_PETCI|nr:hypothetical protein Pcinc_043527 [Petrolisthes cinctipes]